MTKNEIAPTKFEYKVETDYYEQNQLRVYIDKVGTFGFNVNNMSDRDRAWLVSVVTSQMKEIHETSFKLGRDSVINQFKSTFGLLS
jgi:hypothetical protein